MTHVFVYLCAIYFGYSYQMGDVLLSQVINFSLFFCSQIFIRLLKRLLNSVVNFVYWTGCWNGCLLVNIKYGFDLFSFSSHLFSFFI